MEQEFNAFTRFGLPYIPLSWFSTPSENGAIVGLVVEDSDLSISRDSNLRISLDVEDIAREIFPLAVDGISYEQLNQDPLAPDFAIVPDQPVTDGEIIAAFDVANIDRAIGGGDFTLTIEISAFASVDPTESTTLTITGELPRFNEIELAKEVREFWGGTFIGADQLLYEGQPGTKDFVVLPGPSSHYRIEFVDLENNVVQFVINDPDDPLFGEPLREFRVSNAEEVIFGGSAANRNDTFDYTEFANFSGLSQQDLADLIRIYWAYTDAGPTVDELVDLVSLFRAGGSDFSVLREAQLDLSPELSAFNGIDPQDTADASQVNALVTSYYDIFLGRAPDAPGLAFWESQLTDGNVSVSGFQEAFEDGVFAETGGAEDQAYLDHLLEVTALVALDYGFTDAATADTFYDRVTPGNSQAEHEIILEDLLSAFEGATDGLGGDDFLTVGIVGLADTEGM